MTNYQFIEYISKGAIQGWKDYKILPSLTIAQGILESGWGKTKLTKEANNLFGIKKGTGWKGQVYSIKTREQKKDGKEYYVVADFRKYDSWEASISDHGKFLMKDRYKKVRGVNEYKLVCNYIRECGYATDLRYTELLIALIKQYNLSMYDEVALSVPTSKITSESGYNDIAWLQIKLNKLINAGLKVDGIKGKATSQAVINYWKHLGWKTTDYGNAGTQTIQALKIGRK